MSKSIQSPETWGTLTEEELRWARQFGQTLSWDEYQSRRHLFKANSKQVVCIGVEDLAWLKQELGYQRSSDQSRLRYAHPSSIAQLHHNIERQSRILDALTGQDT